MSAPDFWNNQEKAREAVGQLKSLRALSKPLAEVVQSSGDLPAMLELAEGDEAFAKEVRAEIERLEKVLDELELKSLLSGPHDALGAIVSLYARDGGTDAHDWAEMLLRMYTQWAQKNGYDVTLIERQDNEEAGINSATIAIRGPMAYGYLKGETGIHRLVRISPFNAEGKRQTSFAAIDVSPEVSDDIDIQVNWDKDVREETMRAGGAGGQHVNKTESAIRLVHLATGIEVKCQNERSQHQNRAMARKMLLSRLVRLEEEKREAEQAKKYKSQAKVGFGSQIRNYFLHPSQRVKDSRTGYLEHNFHNVLDGNLQGFLDSYLKWRVKGVLAGSVGEEE
jgi:peptide chain release factor 2